MNIYSILLVEDDLLANVQTCELIESQGLDVEAAYCGGAALEVLDRGGPLSALITDIDLGPGPDGFEVARHARRLYRTLPVIFISGSSPTRHEAEGVCGSRFIAKPASPQQILDALTASTFRETA